MSDPVEVEATQTASGDMYGSWVAGDEVSTGDEMTYGQIIAMEFEPDVPIAAGTELDSAELELTFSQDNEYSYSSVEMTLGIATNPASPFPENYSTANTLDLEAGDNVIIPTIDSSVTDTFQVDPESEDPAFSVIASLSVTVLDPNFTANQGDLDAVIAGFLSEFPLIVEGESLSFTVSKTNGVSPSTGCLITVSADYFPDEVGTDQLFVGMQKDGPGAIFISIPLSDAGGLIPASGSNDEFEVDGSFSYEITGVSNLDGHTADSGQEWDTQSPDDYLLRDGKVLAKNTSETIRSCITPSGSSIIGTYNVDVLPSAALTSGQKERHAIILVDRSGSGNSYVAAVELSETTIEVSIESFFHDPAYSWSYRPVRYASGPTTFDSVPDFPVGGLRSESSKLEVNISSGGVYTATYMGLTATWSYGTVLEFSNTGLISWNPTGVYSELSNFSFEGSGPSYENAGDKQKIDIKDLIQSQIDALEEEETLDRVMLVFKMSEESWPSPHYIHGAGAVSGSPKLLLSVPPTGPSNIALTAETIELDTVVITPGITNTLRLTAQTITPDTSVLSPSMTPGSVSRLAAAITPVAVVSSPELSRGATRLTPDTISPNATVSTPVVSLVTRIIVSPAVLQAVVGDPSVMAGGITLTAGTISLETAIVAAEIRPHTTLVADLIDTQTSIFSPVANRRQYAQFIQPKTVVPSPDVTATRTLNSDSIAAVAVVSSPVLKANKTLQAGTVTSGLSIAAPSVSSTLRLVPVAVLSAAAVATPIVSPGAMSLTAESILSQMVISPVQLSSIKRLDASAILASSTVLTPVVTPRTSLRPDSIIAAASIQTPGVGVSGVMITAQSVTSRAVVIAPETSGQLTLIVSTIILPATVVSDTSIQVRAHAARVWTVENRSFNWIVREGNTMAIEILRKQPDESIVFGFDFSSLLSQINSSLSSVESVVASPDGLTLTDEEVSSTGEVANVRVAGGVAGQMYRITVQVETVGGDTLEADGKLYVHS